MQACVLVIDPIHLLYPPVRQTGEERLRFPFLPFMGQTWQSGQDLS